MNRQKTTLAVLLGLLALCAGAYLALRMWNSSHPPATDTISVTAFSDPSSFSFLGTDGETLSFTKQNGVWQWNEDSTFPADQSAVESLAEDLSHVEAVRAISDPEPLSAYGLDSPAYTIQVADSGGMGATLLIGAAVNSDYYAALEGGETVYTISSSLLDTLSIGLMDLAEPESIPSVREDNIQSIQWESGGTTLLLTKDTETLSVESEDTGSTETVTEYHWTVNDNAVPQDNETLSLLLDELSFLGFSSCYDYDAEESVLASCGLTEPALVLTVSYDDGQSFTLSVGQMDGDGTYRFALLNDSRTIQRLSASSIDVLMGLTQEQLLTAPDTEEDT